MVSATLRSRAGLALLTLAVVGWGILMTPVALGQTEAVPLLIHQKLKNATRGDSPSGSTTTVGFRGDRIHHLVMLQQAGEASADYRVTVQLPPELAYLPGSARVYRPSVGEWRDLPDGGVFPLDTYAVRLTSAERLYLTFRTDISTLPESNLALLTVTTIHTPEDTRLTQSATRILAPNARLKETVAARARELTADEKKLLDEEFDFIEAAWDDLNAQPLAPAPPAPADTTPPWLLIVSITIGSLCLFSLLVYAYRRSTRR